MDYFVRHGYSRIEVFCAIGIIVIVAVVGIRIGYIFYVHSVQRGDDKMMVQTCESVVRVNLVDESCVVSNCTDKYKVCPHKIGDGYTWGYYDEVSHKVVDTKMKGYNEYPVMNIDGKEYKGDRGTMIIKVTGKIEDIKLEWVEGEN